MSPEETLALKDIAYKMIALATGEPATELPIAFPPGTVPVKPTGVIGSGKVRFWPEAKASVPPSGNVELFWSYCLRMSETKAPSGENYVPAIYRQQIGAWFLGGGPSPAQLAQYPAACDRWVYPEDWYTQAEIDLRLRSDAEWAENFKQMTGG
jgi:hypothetical protein